MKFTNPTAAELAELRADPILFEQDLDVRPSVATALEKALGFRAGRRHWHAKSGHLYGIDLGDFGRGRASMAIVYAFWPRFVPRPLTDDEIDEDLAELCLWIAEITEGMDAEHVAAVLDLARGARVGGNGFKIPI